MTDAPHNNQSIKKERWIRNIHLVFWTILSGILIFVYQAFVGGVTYALVPTVVNLSGLMMLVYFNFWFLLPRYYDKKNYLQYGVFLFVALLITTFYRFIVGWELINILGWKNLEAEFTPKLFGGFMISGMFFILITIPFRLIEGFFKKEELEKQLKTQQLEAELRFLKAQVNPHFLFNALNNIYSLSFTNSKQAPGMILKLSDMMSYMLYDCKTEKVKLTNEINYLHNFIALQQLKKEGDLNIEFKVVGNLNGIFITPMLFIPFFENAFKHGNLEDIQNGWMKSELKLENEVLFFFIENTIGNKKQNKENGGVGLENVRERLNLLYPHKHRLSIKKSDQVFSVDLEIILKAQTSAINFQ